MKIGICARTWGENGGIGVYSRSVIDAIVHLDTRNEYHILYANEAHLGSLASMDRVREVYLPAKGKWMWDQWAVPKYAHREGLDVIFHTKFTIPFLARCKTAMVLHGTERFIHPEFHQTFDLWYFRTIYPQYLKRASLILAVSERGRQDIIEKLGIDGQKIRTVHLAINPIFRVIDDEKILNGVREKYNLPRKFIIYVGHIYPGKNFGRLVKAFALVRSKHNVDLVVAGSPRWKYEADLALVSKLGLENNIHILGHVSHENLVALYNLADLTAFPSFYESFPAIPLEANACGCPVVISCTGGSPEAAGDAALFVDPMDVQDISGAISRVLGDKSLQQDLIEKGFKNVTRFSWEKTARATLDAIEWVVHST